jgi:hypothetical protein
MMEHHMISNSSNQNVHRHGNAAGNPPRRVSPDAARTAARQATRQVPDDECERLLDDELIDTFPASDPPSWTMGGSLVSTLRH